MSSMSATVSPAIERMTSPFLKAPSTTRMYAMTPRYWSNSESKISARGGASGSPAGGGTRSTSCSSTSMTPSPVLPEMRRISSIGSPRRAGDPPPPPPGLGAGQVELVEHRDQLEAVLDREVRIGDRLRLDALRGIDDEQRALAGGER